MTDEITDLRRRVALIDNEIKSEKDVSRHVLRKVTDNEALIIDVRSEVADLRKEIGTLRKEVSAMHADIVLLRADLPSMIAAAAEILRENLNKRK